MLGSLRAGFFESLRMSLLGLSWIFFEDSFRFISTRDNDDLVFYRNQKPPMVIPQLSYMKEVGAGIGTAGVWSLICVFVYFLSVFLLMSGIQTVSHGP